MRLHLTTKTEWRLGSVNKNVVVVPPPRQAVGPGRSNRMKTRFLYYKYCRCFADAVAGCDLTTKTEWRLGSFSENIVVGSSARQPVAGGGETGGALGSTDDGIDVFLPK
jgi:hypothetical protein